MPKVNSPILRSLVGSCLLGFGVAFVFTSLSSWKENFPFLVAGVFLMLAGVFFLTKDNLEKKR